MTSRGAAVIALGLICSACATADLANYPKGTSYEGEARNGKPNGRGVLTLASGSRLEGTFINGVAQGPGTFTMANGYRQEGTFLNGRLNGPGTMQGPNGRRWEGTFANGVLEGPAMFTMADRRCNADYANGSAKHMDCDFTDGRRWSYDSLAAGSGAVRGTLASPGGERQEGYFLDRSPPRFVGATPAEAATAFLDEGRRLNNAALQAVGRVLETNTASAAGGPASGLPEATSSGARRTSVALH